MEAATVGAGEPIQGEKAQEDDGRGGGGGGRAKEERIRVSVRLRPLNSKELARNDQSDWECISDTTIIFRNTLPERSMFPAAYTFDRVFRHDSDTKRVYEEGAKEVALSVVSGINASIFAYGQTSSGKTYTMTGITEYAMADIYDYIQRHKEREFVLKFSAMEIYNEAVRDLLSADSAPLRLLDDPDRGTTVEKLTEELLRDWGHMQELLSICEAQRQIGETSLNETSSRSHQILRLSIESSAREFAGKDNSSSLAASVNFVDLAGSERASQTLSAGARLKEGCHINRSLLTLGTVIRKLSKGRSGHIPFRDSKLTRILQSSLGGNARTAIICTMSPARSHVEQSRNTLLFASCAKEVATSAQVNVVMSDKALVKHLQKELARLEGELRCSGLPSSSSYSETLLKEKDAQIQKMETEMRELTRQRDLAQSRLDDWLRAAGDREPQQSGEFFPYSMRHGLNTLEDELFPLSESSSVHDDGFICSNALGDSSHCGVNHSDSFQALDSSSASGASSVSSAHKGLQGAAPGGSLEMELCRDVRCIEIDGTSTGADGQSNEVLTKGSHDPPPPPTAIGDLGDREPKEIERVEDVNGRNAIDSSPWLLQGPLPSPRSQGLTRSRSCRASLMHRSAPLWLPEEEQPSAHAQPSSFLRGSSAKSGGFPRTPPPLNCGAGNKRTHLEAGNRSPQREPQSSLEPASIKSEPEESITSISSFIEEMKGMAQNRFQSQLDDAQAEDQKGVDHISSDTAIYPAESPSWPAEFERQRQEIIRLWHTCSVSLLHRTYFFLLFKGDPADSIYMEVELRRLSFLKRVFTEGSVDKSAAENGLKITPASSMRALRREREMLCHKLQKRLSAEERESLYRKWGIPLHSKQRKAQLSRLLWSDTSNMDHIKDSASVVATLVGLLEPDQALKEMFQLSFMPQRIPTRSQSWKHSRSSLI